MTSLTRPFTLPKLTREPIDRSTALSALLVFMGFATVFVAVQRPVLVIEGLCGLAFLAVAVRSPLLATGAFFAIVFLAEILDQVSGGSVNPGVLATKGAGGVLVIVWIYRRLAQGDRTYTDIAVRLFALCAVILVIWSLSSALWSADPHSAVASAARLAQGPLLMVVIVAFVQTVEAFTTLCHVYVVGAALSAAAGLTGLVHTGSLASGARLAGGVGDPNFLAAVLVSAVPVALFMALAPRRSRIYAAVMLGIAAVCLVAVFLTQSRGGVIALGVVLVLSIMYSGRVRAQIFGMSLMVAAIVGIYLALFAPAHALSRLSDLRSGGGTGRTDLWAIALKVYETHPVRGVGLENFTIVSPVYAVSSETDLPRADVVVQQGAPTHNMYLQIAAELGTVGELLFLGLFGVVLEAARRAIRLLVKRREHALELAGRGLFVGAVGMLTAFFFLSAQYEKQLWVALGLLLAFANVVRKPPSWPASGARE